MPRKKSLSESHPHLLEEWDYRKNRSLGLDPEELTYGSNKKAWWICKKEHSWEAAISNRTRNSSSCKYCTNKKAGYGNDLLTNHPELCQEWDFEKNKLGPENYLPNSHKKVWWRCSQKHSWKSVIYGRVFGRGCRFCSNKKAGYGNDLTTKFPKLCKEWDFEKNKLGPDKYLPKSNKKVWWKCSQNHSWKASIYNRTQGNRCKYCSNQAVGYGNDLLTNHPDLCEEWDYEKNKLGPENYTPGSGKKVWWKCSKGHSWTALIFNRALKDKGCRKCSTSGISKASQEWLDSLGIVQREVRINRFRVDGVDPKTNTVYEFLGDYWHGNPKTCREKGLVNRSNNTAFSKLYDQTFRRFDKLRQLGYNIIYIWESDFLAGKNPTKYQ